MKTIICAPVTEAQEAHIREHGTLMNWEDKKLPYAMRDKFKRVEGAKLKSFAEDANYLLYHAYLRTDMVEPLGAKWDRPCEVGGYVQHKTTSDKVRYISRAREREIMQRRKLGREHREWILELFGKLPTTEAQVYRVIDESRNPLHHSHKEWWQGVNFADSLSTYEPKFDKLVDMTMVKYTRFRLDAWDRAYPEREAEPIEIVSLEELTESDYQPQEGMVVGVGEFSKRASHDHAQNVEAV